jgi:fumarylacetoacetase
MPTTDPTHDPARRSFLDSANDPRADFPIQNLPLGVFVRHGGGAGEQKPRIGIAIGDRIVDVPRCIELKLLDGIKPEAACALCAETLNPFMALGRTHWKQVRRQVAALLDESSRLRDDLGTQMAVLVPMIEAEMLLPATIGDYSDFYASIHHATNVGSMFRPDNPLLPNYKHLPVGYHGRASSIVASGTDVRRPMGQTVTSDAGPPTFGACKLLDYEMEMGFFVGPGNELGTRIAMRDAAAHVFGMVIVNDWSARDIQKWEYQPLGPFNAKNFATTISPWVVTLEALAPYRMSGPPRGEGDPQLLDYLKPEEEFALNITVEVKIASAIMREKKMQPMLVSRGNLRDMYWTIMQMLVHHTSTGCNMRPGDLLATGTISGTGEDSRGCLLERTWRGSKPLTLPDGTERKFLQDGDEVIMNAWCETDGFRRIGFGECRGTILPASD